MVQYKYNGYTFRCDIGTMTPKQYEIMIDLLEETKPKIICELGSGQSTEIFEEYQNKNTNIQLYSIEHNPHFNTHKSCIMFPLLENINYLQHEGCVAYTGFNEWIDGQDNFDFILIDGPNDVLPVNINNIQYSRIQLLDFINKLNPGSIVMYHDSNVSEAKTTLSEFEKLLGDNNIQYDKEVIVETNNQIIEYNVAALGMCPELTVYKLK